MNPNKRLTGACSECGGSIEFPAELVGTMTQCPRCGKRTELTLPVLPDEPTVPRKVIVWTVVTVAVLVLGLVVVVVGLNHYAKLAERQRARTGAAAGTNDTATAPGFEVSTFSLEKGQGSQEGHAVGTVVNTYNRPRSRITLKLDLLDAGGQTVCIAKAFRPVLEPGAKWEIKLPVASDSKAVSARVSSIQEGQ
jgi:hypothetical protein